jgi:2Fe-2S ferredoxin
MRGTDTVIRVDPANLPQGQDGHPGSLLSIFLAHGLDIDHACGGVVACSTCHVYVQVGFDSAPEPIEEEEDMLDLAPAVRDSSRLACQCVPDGTQDVEVAIPSWNRNEVSEEH